METEQNTHPNPSYQRIASALQAKIGNSERVARRTAADQIKISETTLDLILANKHPVSMADLKKIEEWLGLPLADLI